VTSRSSDRTRPLRVGSVSNRQTIRATTIPTAAFRRLLSPATACCAAWTARSWRCRASFCSVVTSSSGRAWVCNSLISRSSEIFSFFLRARGYRRRDKASSFSDGLSDGLGMLPSGASRAERRRLNMTDFSTELHAVDGAPRVARGSGGGGLGRRELKVEICQLLNLSQ
jgi:hypothetical protein